MVPLAGEEFGARAEAGGAAEGIAIHAGLIHVVDVGSKAARVEPHLSGAPAIAIDRLAAAGGIATGQSRNLPPGPPDKVVIETDQVAEPVAVFGFEHDVEIETGPSLGGDDPLGVLDFENSVAGLIGVFDNRTVLHVRATKHIGSQPCGIEGPQALILEGEIDDGPGRGGGQRGRAERRGQECEQYGFQENLPI